MTLSDEEWGEFKAWWEQKWNYQPNRTDIEIFLEWRDLYCKAVVSRRILPGDPIGDSARKRLATEVKSEAETGRPE